MWEKSLKLKTLWNESYRNFKVRSAVAQWAKSQKRIWKSTYKGRKGTKTVSGRKGRTLNPHRAETKRNRRKKTPE